MIKTSMVRTITIAVPLALVGTFLIPTFVMAQIDGSELKEEKCFLCKILFLWITL